MAANDIPATRPAIPRHVRSIWNSLFLQFVGCGERGLRSIGTTRRSCPKMASRRFSPRLYCFLARLLMCGVGIRGADQNFAGDQFPGGKLCAEDADLLALLHVAHIDGLVSMLVLGLVIQRDSDRTGRSLQ